MSSRSHTVSTPDGDVSVTVTESGAGGRPVLLLHGGAGPDSVTGFGGALAERFPFRVLSPVYPGFSGTARPGWLDSIGTLAGVLGGLLEDLGATVISPMPSRWLVVLPSSMIRTVAGPRRMTSPPSGPVIDSLAMRALPDRESLMRVDSHEDSLLS